MGKTWVLRPRPADIVKRFKPTTFRKDKPDIGRNEKCPCGSGLKYKNVVELILFQLP